MSSHFILFQFKHTTRSYCPSRATLEEVGKADVLIHVIDRWKDNESYMRAYKYGHVHTHICVHLDGERDRERDNMCEFRDRQDVCLRESERWTDRQTDRPTDRHRKKAIKFAESSSMSQGYNRWSTLLYFIRFLFFLIFPLLSLTLSISRRSSPVYEKQKETVLRELDAIGCR